MKKILIRMIIFLCMIKGFYADANELSVQPISFNSGFDQHGSFLADDLLSSPLLRSMFNVSAVKINKDLVRVCINDQFSECKIVKHDAKVYLETSNGRVKFDKAE